ncbi:MAG TPA: UbiA family prenyltransferase [Candidatus Saccharimonadales bacterium]|nr:UbiA family prenyltransferase [Candidatus Saccharimonadales bacterium]
MAGLVRLVHPFPSLLDAGVAAVLTAVAGGTAETALRLAGSMFALQSAIGTLNDLVDEPRDRLAKPAKPIPSGDVGRGRARGVLIVLAAAGLGLAAMSGPWVVTIALLGLAIGVAYDLRLKGTVWSWLPFALGVPLLPVFAWVGDTGRLPPAFALILPAGVAAGASLAVANLLADIDRDRSIGVETLATRLGQTVAWRVGAILAGAVIAAALGSLVVLGGARLGIVVSAMGGILVAGGVALGRQASATRRERGWELQAIGVAVLAAGWVAALAGTAAI